MTERIQNVCKLGTGLAVGKNNALFLDGRDDAGFWHLHDERGNGEIIPLVLLGILFMWSCGQAETPNFSNLVAN